MLQSPVSIRFCFSLGTVKPCFVSESVIKTDPRIVRFSFSNKILIFWATIVIQNFYTLSQKSGQQSTLFEPFTKHFCVHYFHFVKDSKQLLILQLSNTPRNSMFHVVCLLGLKVFGGQNENSRREPSIKNPSSLIMFLSVSSISNTIKDILIQNSVKLKKAGRKFFT